MIESQGDLGKLFGKRKDKKGVPSFIQAPLNLL